MLKIWKKSRSWILFGAACVLSPCCTPLIVPAAISLIVGTPAALWASAYLGWVYGALSLISLFSVVIGMRWLSQGKRGSIGKKGFVNNVQSMPNNELRV